MNTDVLVPAKVVITVVTYRDDSSGQLSRSAINTTGRFDLSTHSKPV